MKISLNTIGCPGWTWERVVRTAADFGLHGIELRGAEGENNLPQSPPFRPDRIDRSLALLREKRLEIACLSTSCRFDTPDAFDAYLQEGMDSIDLAVRLGAPSIRVFGDSLPPDGREEAFARIVEGIGRLAAYAEERGVHVLMETHGDFCRSDLVLEILRRTASRAVGVLWDVDITFKHGREDVGFTYAKLGPLIRHVHIKDSVGYGTGSEKRLCAIGSGDVPLAACLQTLRDDGYEGYVSLEWEKMWHPELDDVEIALPPFIRLVEPYLA